MSLPCVHKGKIAGGFLHEGSAFWVAPNPYQRLGHDFTLSFNDRHRVLETMTAKKAREMGEALIRLAEMIEPESLVSKEALLTEALRNAKGLIDTPIGRRRHAGDPFYAEVVDSLRKALGEDNGPTD